MTISIFFSSNIRNLSISMKTSRK